MNRTEPVSQRYDDEKTFHLILGTSTRYGTTRDEGREDSRKDEKRAIRQTGDEERERETKRDKERHMRRGRSKNPPNTDVKNKRRTCDGIEKETQAADENMMICTVR